MAPINKAVRLAFLAIINQEDPIQRGDSGYLALAMGAAVRSIQRDLKQLPRVHALIEKYHVLKQSAALPEKTYSVPAAASFVGLTEYSIRRLASFFHIGHKVKSQWRFTRQDIVALNNRPRYWYDPKPP
jgi:hypothetical protein